MAKTFCVGATILALSSVALAQPAPVAYAFGFEDLVNGPTRFGVLDIGSGSFYRGVDHSQLAQGLARDAHGRIYIVDEKANLLRVTPGNFKTELVGNTGVSTPWSGPNF